MTDDELSLIKKAKSGDISSFEKLISSYQGKIYNLAYSLVGNPQDAQDIAQEAIIKVFQSLNKFQERCKFSTYLYRIVVNVFKDEMRKAYKKYKQVDYESVSSYSPNPVERVENRLIIEEVLREIPRDFAIIIILRDLQGFSYEEISDILNIPLGTVKSRISFARKIFKEKIKEKNFFSDKSV